MLMISTLYQSMKEGGTIPALNDAKVSVVEVR